MVTPKEPKRKPDYSANEYRAAIGRLGMTHTKVAGMLGVSRRGLEDRLYGRVRIRDEMMYAVFYLLDIIQPADEYDAIRSELNEYIDKSMKEKL